MDCSGSSSTVGELSHTMPSADGIKSPPGASKIVCSKIVMFIALALGWGMLPASLQLPREGSAQRCAPAAPAGTRLPQPELEGSGEPAAALVLWAPH